MKEVNKPKRMLRNFYLVALAVLLVLNMVIMPMIMNAQVKETDYGTFMTMTNEGNVGLVQIVETENYIMFTDKAETLDAAEQRFLDAVCIGDTAPSERPLIVDMIEGV